MRIDRLLTLSPIVFSAVFATELEGGLNSKEETVCEKDPRPMRIAARHIEPKGIGYNNGYTTIEGFFPLYNGWERWRLFLDARGHIFNNGQPAVNAGLGTRYLTTQRAWGINAYYDYRKTKHQHYNQVAMGLESLGSRWDFRLNGYLPVGKKQSRDYALEFWKFKGHQAKLRTKYEYALAGLNGEAAVHVDTWQDFPLYFAGGPYYLHGKGGSAWGGKVRASVMMYDYVKLEGNVSYDHLFKWIGQGELSLSVPFGKRKEMRRSKGDPGSCQEAITLVKRANQPVDRFEIIPVDKQHRLSTAINPLTDLPYYFVFVNNTSSSDGTFESPYPNLTLAHVNSFPYDVIYIFPGDGTTTGMDSGITLKDQQWLWGSGVVQTLPTTVGQVLVPQFSNNSLGGVLTGPVLTNASGAVVTVANGNQISGLYLLNQGSNYCITGSNITNLSVLNSTLAPGNASGYKAIYATNLTGTLTVAGSVFNQSQHNIEIVNSGGSVNVNISNSIFGNNASAAPVISLALSNAARGDLLVNDISLIGTGNGIEVDVQDTSSIQAGIYNSFVSSGEYGIYFNSLSGATDINLNFVGNNLYSYYQGVVVIQTGAATTTLSQNSIINTDGPSFELDVNAGSTQTTVLVDRNIMNCPDSPCVSINQVAGNLTTTVKNNELIGSDYGSGILSQLGTGTVSHSLIATGNDIHVGYRGIDINHIAGSFTGVIEDNSITTLYGENDISLVLASTAQASDLSINRNALRGDHGFAVQSSTTSNLQIAFNENNVICQTPFILTLAGGTTSLQMNGNTLEGGYGALLTHSSGTFDATIQNNTVLGVYEYGLEYTGSSAEAATLAIKGNTLTSSGFSNSDGSGVALITSGTGTVSSTVTGNILNGVAYGAYVTSSAGVHVMDLSNNIMTSGGGYFLTLPAMSTASATWSVNQNTFVALTTVPITVDVEAGNLCLQLNHNTAYPTTGAYNLLQTTGTFILNPPVGNVGAISLTGSITEAACP